MQPLGLFTFEIYLFHYDLTSIDDIDARLQTVEISCIVANTNTTDSIYIEWFRTYGHSIYTGCDVNLYGVGERRLTGRVYHSHVVLMNGVVLTEIIDVAVCQRVNGCDKFAVTIDVIS